MNRVTVAAENLALRQQLSVLKSKAQRARPNWRDRVFWVVLSKLWGSWQRVLVFVQPATVIGWHRHLFKLYWTRKTRNKKKSGRPKVSKEIQQLIARMTRENVTWGAPRIVKEMALLGHEVSESTVHRYRDQSTKPPSQNWRTFLQNHKSETVAMDFFTVPTVSFSVLYCFIILDHARRKIVHFNVTYHPTAQWTALQIRQAFPWETAPRFLLRDNDKVYGNAVLETLETLGIEEVRISPYCPWQNPFVERVVGSIRRDCLDHMIVFGEDHLRDLMPEYIVYYNRCRCHESLDGNAPIPREKETGARRVQATPFLSGLHHHYGRAAA
ncbi:MAG: transposase [Planctomycetota bacterium]|jgi:transposase InsO family protein